ncbi:HAD family hydrolase [Celerinatantimonas sp. YJH-8]|uniref:HAD family hydrolase n=1 Tax=Celerinatantimonas sp. YJH-8 TaxID=3228714 RepID=UPI0038C00D1B
MRETQLVATDMDHTLLTEMGEIPPMFESCVKQLKQLGVSVAIASGRPLYTLRALFPRLADDLIFISDNGAAIAHQDDFLFKSIIEASRYQQLVRYVEQHTSGVAVICGLDTAYVSQSGLPHMEFLKRFYAKIQVVEKLSAVDAIANKFTVYFPNADAQASYENDFMPRFNHDYSITLGDTMWIDMMNPGVNKGTAMHFMGKALQISTEQMMAFGDTYNDIEMLQAVKYSYTMANAHPDMRQYAKFMTKSNDEYGVIQILEQLIQTKTSEWV